MSFEEQFPDLLNCDTIQDEGWEEPGDIGFSIKDIMEHCLDKQKVREAVETVISALLEPDNCPEEAKGMILSDGIRFIFERELNL